MAKSYITGPFTLYVGEINPDFAVNDVSAVSFDYSANSTQPTTIDGRTFDIPTSTSLSVTATIIGATPSMLGVIFPSKLKNLGENVSTGETITATEEDPAPKVLDLTSVTACDSSTPVDIYLVGCTHTYRINDVTAKISSIEIEDNVLVNVSIVFTSIPQVQENGVMPAAIQIYPNGTLVEESGS